MIDWITSAVAFCLLLACAAHSRRAILLAVVLIAPFQGLGLFPVAGSRLYAFTAAIMLFVLRSAYDVFFSGARISIPKAFRVSFYILFGFVCWATVVSMISPHIFAGIPVYSPREGIDSQTVIRSLLAPSISNYLQVSYLILNALFVLSAICIVPTIPALFVRRAILSSIVMVFSLLAINYGLILIGRQDLLSFCYTFGDGIEAFGQLGGDRPFVPFAEPSYAGVFLAATTSVLIGMYLTGAGLVPALLLLMGFALVTVVRSSLGIAATAIGCLAVCALLAVFCGGKTRVRVMIGVASIAVVILGVLPFAYDFLVETYRLTFSEKIGGSSFSNRDFSNQDSLAVMTDTFFIGAGLGSHRASSLIFTLLSTTGLVGFILFFSLFTIPWLSAWKTKKINASFIVSASFVVSAIIASIIGWPDISYPFIWLGLIWVWLTVLEGRSDNVLQVSGASLVVKNKLRFRVGK